MNVRIRLFKQLDDFRLTPTERKVLKVLCDGEPHSREKLHKCLPDELSELRAIHKHLDNLRPYLAERGFLLRCVLLGGKQSIRPHYQIFRHVCSLFS